MLNDLLSCIYLDKVSLCQSFSVCRPNNILNRVVYPVFSSHYAVRRDKMEDVSISWAFNSDCVSCDIDYTICRWKPTKKKYILHVFRRRHWFFFSVALFSNLKSKTEKSCPEVEFRNLFRNYIESINTPNAVWEGNVGMIIIVIVTVIESLTNIWLGKKIFIDISETISINLKCAFVLNYTYICM